ncbi:MAG TPA: tetratricopeptide repeat protein [Chitinophagales bacterium]|nr:tetratricopeptide repeat protein [Chitinophagales bacterium]
MKKLFLVTTLSILTIGAAFAQRGKVNTAEFNLTTGDVEKAKENIDGAFSDESMNEWSKAWRVKGDVYKSIYELKDVNSSLYASTPNTLTIAKEAYIKFYNIEEKPKRKAQIKDGLKSVGAYFYNNGIAAYGKNNWEVAYDNFNQALEISEFLYDKDLESTIDTNAYFVVLLSSYNSQNLEDALKAGEKLVELNDERPEVYTVLINVHQQMGNDKEYEKTITEARSKFPDDTDILFHEINLYLKNDELDKLEEKLELAIDVDPNNPSLYQAMASVYDRKGNQEGALKMYDKAIEADPQYIDAYINKASIYNKEANVVIEKMNSEMDNKKYDLLKRERDAIFKDKMIPLLRKALSINPDNENVKVVLKEIYARLDMMDEVKKLD